MLDRFESGELGAVHRGNLDTDIDTAILQTDRHEKCSTDAPTNNVFSSWQKAGEADINGDGLPDHIYANDADRTNITWRVRFNTGVGWTDFRIIRSPLQFAVSEASGVCSTGAQSAAGLTDLDGDGIPELLRVRNGMLLRSKLETNSLAVGRLTSISNGYGATTYIRYANAKTDTATKHAVPFAEVVVAETGTNVEGDGTGLAPVFYAYGDASLHYEPMAGGWVFSGYL